MTMLKEVKSKGLYMGKLSHGADLLDEITGICSQKHVRLGRIEALGAVQHARLGYYDQKSREYDYFILDQGLEITNLVGNVSVKQGQPIVHAHITLTDSAGRAYGGHLAQGTKVFACEMVLEVFEGPTLERGYDEATGLPLWKQEE